MDYTPNLPSGSSIERDGATALGRYGSRNVNYWSSTWMVRPADFGSRMVKACLEVANLSGVSEVGAALASVSGGGAVPSTCVVSGGGVV